MEKAITKFLGNLLIIIDKQKVVRISFVEEIGEKNDKPSQVMEKTIKQISGYFQGTRTQFELPLQMNGTDFQVRIWKLLSLIPFGSTMAYVKVAKKFGDSKMIRAVVSAVIKNPLSIVIPCHRIIGSDGSMVGYSGGIKISDCFLDMKAILNKLMYFSEKNYEAYFNKSKFCHYNNFIPLYNSKYRYLFRGVSTIYLQGHTTAFLEDYKSFSNNQINGADKPIPSLHKLYNSFPLNDDLKKYNEERKTVAYLVFKNDSILFEKYYKGFDASSKTNSFSMVKSIVSAMMGIASGWAY